MHQILEFENFKPGKFLANFKDGRDSKFSNIQNCHTSKLVDVFFVHITETGLKLVLSQSEIPTDFAKNIKTGLDLPFLHEITNISFRDNRCS